MEHINRELLEKYLLGKCTTEERLRVESWLEEEGNWSITELEDADPIKGNHYWQEIERHINRQTQTSSETKKLQSARLSTKVIWIAAAMLIFCLIGYEYATRTLSFPKGFMEKSDFAYVSEQLTGEMHVVGFRGDQERFAYRVESAVTTTNRGGNVFFTNTASRDVTLHVKQDRTDDKRASQYLLRSGKTYVVVYVRGDEMLDNCNNILILCLDELGKFPPHEAVQWTKEQVRKMKVLS